MAFERQKGQAEGRAEGLKEGRAEGLEEGRAEGLKEGHTKGKLEVARNLKQMGMATEAIAQATGLAPDVVGQLWSRLLPQNDEKERRSFDQMADFLLLCTLVNVPYDIFVCKNLS